MNLANVPNPYEFANPVTRPDRFAGRQSELGDIRYYLRQARSVEQPVNLALVGARAAGKTSLLNIIEYEAEKLGLLTARINLNSADGEPIRLFWKLYEAVMDTAMDAGYLFRPGSDEDRIYRALIDGLNTEADSPTFPLRFPAHYAASVQGGRQISENKLARDLATIFNATKIPFVLLFDECNVLAQNRVTLEMLRNVFMSMPGYLLVLTGTPEMFPLFDEVFSPIIRQFKKIPVEPFENYEETETCITGPLTASGLEKSNIVFNPRRLSLDVHQLSGGRPYEIQLLCHIMFRRVQERRADKMALTANVIDDVLRELDLTASRPGSRPVVRAVHQLDQRELSALGILGQCDGNATLDELWFLNQLRLNRPNISRQDLALHLETLTSKEILSVDDSGKVGFLGDEFERVYISYFAESRDLTFRISPTPYIVALDFTLQDVLESFGPAECPTSDDGGLRIEEAVEALLSPVKELRNDTDVVHPWILEATVSGCLLLLRVTLSYGSGSVIGWVPSPNDYVRTDLAQFVSKVEALGGTLTVQELSYGVPTEEEYIKNLLNRGDENTLSDLGSYHADQAVYNYLNGNSDEVWHEINLALRFPLQGEEINNVGYMHITAGRFEDAAGFFRRCLESAVDLGPRVEALVLYNLALSWLGCKELQTARDVLTAAKDRFSSAAIGKYECQCLFVLAQSDNRYMLMEEVRPELGQVIASTQQTIESIEQADVPIIEIRPYSWPAPDSDSDSDAEHQNESQST